MRKRLFLAMCSLLSLVAGAMLYGLYRPDTYIGAVISEALPFSLRIKGWFLSFAAFYLPDFLWMFAMTCALFAVLMPYGKAFVIWCALAFSVGVAWELLQLCGLLSGTADIHDVILYSVAVIAAAITKKTIEEKCKK